ncbi:aspartic proteinase CDR1-like [Neltuma alba]|uniref:aspartic proteinase CDR1-like n=1 Tax=Neltuma alba TaxID=207710 RepID=UPI0010A35688|nr:aspartic proteinase CDR1-like [Prosopis alba]
MALSSKPYTLSFTIFIIFFIFYAKATKLGFTVDLIHRDSPLSPLFDNSTTRFQKIHNALRRSTKRLNHFFPGNNNNPTAQTNQEDDPVSELTTSEGEYLMAYSLGNPEFQTRAFIDTGSDLLWLQCFPCKSCYPQNTPKLEPLLSSTHINVDCNSQRCKSAGESVTRPGSIRSDTLTLGSSSGGKVKFPRFIFGCGHNNSKFSRGTSGVVGLGRGPLSLASQLSNSIEGRFSYCLVPSFEASPGKLKFGENAVVSGSDVVSTPMVSKSPPNYYYLTLEAMSVGNKRIGLTPVVEGNVIIDSGTTLTFLPQYFYNKLEAEVSAVMDRTAKRVKDPFGKLKLCYETRGAEDIGAPAITVHFKGADVKLFELNAFILVEEEVECFAFMGASSGPFVFGNLAQLNWLVGYDLEEALVSFKPADCTKL